MLTDFLRAQGLDLVLSRHSEKSPLNVSRETFLLNYKEDKIMALAIGDIVALARAGYKLNDIKALQEAEKEEHSKEEPSREEPSKEEPSKEEPPKEEPPKEEPEEVKALRLENEALKNQIIKMQKDNVDNDVQGEEQNNSLSDIIRTYM